MTDTAPAVAHWDRMYETATRSAWTQNPLVARDLYVRMTGQPGFWMDWTFRKGLPPIDRILSIGCGDGGHEHAIARSGFAKHITAFDASPIAIEQGASQAQREGLNIDFSVRTFEDFIDRPGAANAYDAVLFTGSLHHVRDLEGMLSTVRSVLVPGGRVIVNEYCGPCYQLYPDSQVSLVNRVLASLDERFLVGPNARLELPTIEMVMGGDPTEGVRSSMIPLLVPMYFQREHERFLGGGLLHPIFGYLNASKVNDGSWESDTLVKSLIGMETELTRSGALNHDFMFGIYQNVSH